MFEEKETLESKKLAYQLVQSMSNHPNGAESIIVSGMVENCYEKLKIECAEIQQIILSIFENISAISPQELIKQSNCISVIIDFINFERFTKHIAQLAASIMMNLW